MLASVVEQFWQGYDWGALKMRTVPGALEICLHVGGKTLLGLHLPLKAVLCGVQAICVCACVCFSAANHVSA